MPRKKDPWLLVEFFDLKGAPLGHYKVLKYSLTDRELPGVMVLEDRYFVLCEGDEYHESEVSFLPAGTKPARKPQKGKKRA